jgi:pyruvate,water dikinase
MNLQYTTPLSQAEDVRNVGAKAYHLSRMAKLGLPVPPGFVVTNAAFQNFLDENRLREPIAALLKGLRPHETERLQSVARAIRELITAAEIPAQIRESVTAMRSEILSDTTVIVRSSAVGEDSAEASFAGQLDSCLDVTSDSEIAQALAACWASYWSERSLFYQISRNISLDGMGVVIQQMVGSCFSGVLFTTTPAAPSDDDEQLWAEYCFGHGEALVSGRINPGRFTISRADFRWQKQASPEQADQPRGEEMLFNDERMTQLARMGLELEREFGAPQDIEWTIDHDGKLYCVQTRPVTTVAPSAGARRKRAEQAPSDGSRVVWSNANVSENFPEPITPLLYSIASAGYYHYFRNLGRAFGISSNRIRAMEFPLRNIIGTHGARMYYNLTNIHAVLRAAPFGELLAEWFNHFVGATQMPPGPRRVAAARGIRQNRTAQLFELFVIAIKTSWQYLFLRRRIEAFEHTISEFSERTQPETLGERSLADLLDHLRDFFDIRCHRWNNAALADAASMVCYGALKRLLNREFPTADQAALHNTLLKGLPDVVSSLPVLKLWELSRRIRDDASLTALFTSRQSQEILIALDKDAKFAPFKSALDGYLKKWGFRCSGELMLTTPSFQENPAALLGLLQSYVESDAESPLEVMRRQDTERAAETQKVLKALADKKLSRFVPLVTRAHIIGLVLKWTQRSITYRERARLKQALFYSRCRRIALVIGKELVERGSFERREDVFFLTIQELDALVSGNSMFPYHIKELVARRRSDHAELSTMSPPDTLELAVGEYLEKPKDARPASRPTDAAIEPAEMAGVGACGGKVTGRASILKDMSESRLLQTGDILVTRQTDPGWGPLFFLIRGLVLERGGMLSHGAIIAREFGIPSVVGVKDATLRIPQGGTISIDGDRGFVRLAD